MKKTQREVGPTNRLMPDKPPMKRRRGNPNWGKPELGGPMVPVITEFEKAVSTYELSPDEYLQSPQLREWARRNKNSKFIPEALLKAWGFEIEMPD